MSDQASSVPVRRLQRLAGLTCPSSTLPAHLERPQQHLCGLATQHQQAGATSTEAATGQAGQRGLTRVQRGGKAAALGGGGAVRGARSRHTGATPPTLTRTVAGSRQLPRPRRPLAPRPHPPTLHPGRPGYLAGTAPGSRRPCGEREATAIIPAPLQQKPFIATCSCAWDGWARLSVAHVPWYPGPPRPPPPLLTCLA